MVDETKVGPIEPTPLQRLAQMAAQHRLWAVEWGAKVGWETSAAIAADRAEAMEFALAEIDRLRARLALADRIAIDGAGAMGRLAALGQPLDGPPGEPPAC